MVSDIKSLTTSPLAPTEGVSHSLTSGPGYKQAQQPATQRPGVTLEHSGGNLYNLPKLVQQIASSATENSPFDEKSMNNHENELNKMLQQQQTSAQELSQILREMSEDQKKSFEANLQSSSEVMNNMKFR
ncbi:hypothetical protein [Motiliproteus sp. MSK22-1]|uniref:hypothetical protein n=1 Tax=Motiliproteus sp. MSK22-1 TaxID=1897630 RepID=UPI0009766272|nr:hypothetical protein [Motiliproteus sp. MSK22-1]OMH25630.1 hypothetical protein BGP75_24085 [Motiliproteus sp. MSK22-1]